jgi:hypothetical protein
MATLVDIPYDRHRLIVVVAVAFFVLGAAVVPLRGIRVGSTELGAALVFAPALVLVLVLGTIADQLAWAGDSDALTAPIAGATSAFAWISGMQLRNAELSPRLRLFAVLPFLVVAGFLWTRDAPPPVGAAEATRVFETHHGQAGNPYVCRRYASGDDGAVNAVAGAQFRCDPALARTRCKPGQCDIWWISLDRAGQIREAISPGAP